MSRCDDILLCKSVGKDTYNGILYISAIRIPVKSYICPNTTFVIGNVLTAPLTRSEVDAHDSQIHDYSSFIIVYIGYRLPS